MNPTEPSGKAEPSTRSLAGMQQAAQDTVAPGTADATGGRPLGPHAAAILASEHWSLLATRSLIWNEALNRASVFLTVLSAAIIALALLADATGFGPQTTALALVLLPVVLLLGVATYVRQVHINVEERRLVLAMNRLRHGYLQIEPGLAPYFTTGHHDDMHGAAATYMHDQTRGWFLVRLLINTPTIVGTVVAALAAAIAVLLLQVAEASRAVVVASGAVVLLLVWAGLMVLQRRAQAAVSGTTSKFPTPPASAES